MKRNFVILLIAALLSSVFASILLASCAEDELVQKNVLSNLPEGEGHKISLDLAIEFANQLLPQTRADEFKIKIVPSEKSRSSLLPDTLAYILNTQDKNGFVVVSADDRMSPILAFSDEGEFTYKEDLNDPIYSLFINKLGAYYLAAINGAFDDENNFEKPAEEKELPTRAGGIFHSDTIIMVAPRLSRSWHQGAPEYCAYIVQDHPGHNVGCVAITVGQVMIHGKNNFTFNNKNYNCVSLRNKLKNPASSTELAQTIDSIAVLLNDISNDPIINMQYHDTVDENGNIQILEYPGLSSTYAAYRFLNREGFELAQTTYHNIYNKSDMISFLQNGYLLCVDARMIIESNNQETGHSFVGDGCVRVTTRHLTNGGMTIPVTKYLLHFDWGVGGQGNGYYESNVFTVTTSYDTYHINGNINNGVYYFAVGSYLRQS